jgi:type IV fimbrial biogenesis protein FimT
LEWSAFPSPNYAIYYPNGTASSNGTFTFCDERGAAAAKALIIAKSGRVRVSDKAVDGTALQCPS